MEKDTFFKVFGNLVLCRSIFTKVRFIHTIVLKNSRVFKWNEVMCRPQVMVGNNYLNEFKQYFYRNTIDTLLLNFSAIIINATRTGNLEILRYIIDEIQFEIMIRSNRALQLDMLSAAALHGYLHIIKYYQTKPKFRFDCELAIKMAIEGGHVQLIEYLVGMYKMSSTELLTDQLLIDHAAKCNRFDILRYLHCSNVGTGTYSAMDNAAYNNNLDMLKWLYYNRSDGCSVESFYFAIDNNNLEMLKWLYENTSKGHMAPNALRKAEAKGNIEIIHWIKTIEKIHLYSQRCKEIQSQTVTSNHPSSIVSSPIKM